MTFKTISILTTLSLLCGYLSAQQQNVVHRTFQYRPEGKDIVCVNGHNRFTRALYGSHTIYRVETSDRPEFVVTDTKLSRNLKLTLHLDNLIIPLDSTDYCEARYEAGKRMYTLKDNRFGDGIVHVSVLAFPEREGGIWQINADNLPKNAILEAQLFATKAKKLKRFGDIGKFEETGYFDAVGPVLSSVNANISKGDYITVERDSLVVLNKKKGDTEFCNAENARLSLANSVVFNTPDSYINPLGGNLVMSADGAWNGQVWCHGAVGWYMPLPGWRGAYAGDILGMQDRQRIHFDAYAKSQVVDVPVTQPHTMDAKNNLSRGAYIWGTPLYSNGYICRNPENSHQFHHYDMNLVYIDQLMWHFQFDADTAYMRKMWPVITRHLAWEKNTFDPDNDHLYDAYCCIWASDALQYNSGAVTHSSAYNYRGNLLAARIAEKIGEDPTPYQTEAEEILKAMNERLWLKDEGHWAEFQDFMGNKLIHKDAAVWSIYTPIDCGVCTPEQSYLSTKYVDRCIPHIYFDADGSTYETVSTTDWEPYEWSLNNVALEEVMNTAFAYYESGRVDEAYKLLKGGILDFMYLGSSPGNFGQLSTLDAVTGEGYRDFADATGASSRALIEGLFGIIPQALDGECIIRPGFPSDWTHASIKTPYLEYSFERKDGNDCFKIHQSFSKPLTIVIRQNIGGGKYKDYKFSSEPDQTVSVPTLTIKDVVEEHNPLLAKNQGCDFSDIDSTHCKTVNIANLFNANITDIFKQKYLSPRSPYTTLCLPTQGIGDWCSTKRIFNVDDSGLRNFSKEGVFMALGIPFLTPNEGKNVVYTSLWDNYPDSIIVPLKGKASHIYLMMVGSTNPMQSHFDNALLEVTYKDGTKDSLILRNPDNWCPIEQDYQNDGKAFRLPEPLPYRVGLKSGKVSRNLAKDLNEGSFTNANDEPINKRPIYEIKGGTAQLLDFPVNSQKKLVSLKIKVLANDIVLGLMSLTLQ